MPENSSIAWALISLVVLVVVGGRPGTGSSLKLEVAEARGWKVRGFKADMDTTVDIQGQATLPLSTVSGLRPPPSTWRRLLGSSRWSRNLAPREGFSLVSAQTGFLPLPQPVLPPRVCLPDDRHVASILVPGPKKTA